MEPSREAQSAVLVVSNDPAVRDMLANLLSGEGFHVALAGSGAEALKIAANAPFDTALVELFLPDYSGVEFKRRLARVSPRTRVVVLSSFTTIRSSDDVLRFGTSDFIIDQREIVELLRAASAVRPAIAKPAAGDEERLRKCLIDTVDVLIGLLEVNDPFFGGNSHITMEYARSVAEEMKLDRETIDEIVVGSLLHDIGRVGIKSDILVGKREISESEFKTVRSHCENGAKIIDAVDFPWKVKPIIIHHHERYDGKGYPSGLKGREIPIGARILAVVDAFTAMTAHRPYRSRSLTREEAIRELHKNVGTQFDPEVVELFTSVVDRKFHFRGLGPKPRILMVDDEIDYLMLLKLKLVNEGFDVDAADNATDALAAMEKDPPDLVVADVMMPGMDGIEMFRRMREANAPWGDTPLVFLSGKDESQTKVDALHLGAEDFLVKPVDLKELAARIRNVIRQGRVKSLHADHIVMDEGRVAVANDTLFIDCTASAVVQRPPEAVFQSNTIVPGLLRAPLVAFSAALTAYVEVHYDDEAHKNQLCSLVPFTYTLDDYPKMLMANMTNQWRWGKDKAL
ncbi:MAG: hypothetical protein B7Z74_00885, partial [Deltaproteobacteria bacterium 21-66-5]